MNDYCVILLWNACLVGSNLTSLFWFPLQRKIIFDPSSCYVPGRKLVQYESRTEAVEDEAISLGEQEISDLFSDELSDVHSERRVKVTQTVAVTGDNKQLWPHKIKVKVEVVKLRGQPHGEK
ncbi:hypothetical protein B7P43_G11434 [Cryptotermes secundus]|uniref:Uncharacterized protein n=1 Tax=Cryptotermes secundus TaxID=105785 RepID=A0A2J7QYM7_9NEOP|nr:hypothetical protein B7P43_G11434 [Cryptotermes secundus]